MLAESHRYLSYVSECQAANFPRLLLEFVINLTNDISTSPVRLNGMKIPHLWNTPRQVMILP